MTTTGSRATTQGEDAPRRTRRRWRRTVTRLVVALAVVTTVLLLAGGWYFSGEIRSGAFEVRHTQPTMNLRVVDASPHSVTLEESGDRQAALRRDDTYGLAWETGYGRVTGSPHVDGGTVTRDFVLVDGSLPAPGERARLDRDAIPADQDPPALPGGALDEVTYRSPLGRFHAWQSPGQGRTWVI